MAGALTASIPTNLQVCGAADFEARRARAQPELLVQRARDGVLARVCFLLLVGGTGAVRLARLFRHRQRRLLVWRRPAK